MIWQSIFDKTPPINKFCAFIDSGGFGDYGYFMHHPAHDNVILFAPHRTKLSAFYIRLSDENYCKNHFWIELPLVPAK